VKETRLGSLLPEDLCVTHSLCVCIAGDKTRGPKSPTPLVLRVSDLATKRKNCPNDRNCQPEPARSTRACRCLSNTEKSGDLNIAVMAGEERAIVAIG